jgi:hypothetical protein
MGGKARVNLENKKVGTKEGRGEEETKEKERNGGKIGRIAKENGDGVV